jgi:hypothetical protein
MLHTRKRLAKRRRALVETNLLRNSQPETHPYDGYWGVGGIAGASSVDRFPHAL